ncbi:MAG: hypothetical protein ACK4MD_07160 [Demequina sp.]
MAVDEDKSLTDEVSDEVKTNVVKHGDARGVGVGPQQEKGDAPPVPVVKRAE